MILSYIIRVILYRYIDVDYLILSSDSLLTKLPCSNVLCSADHIGRTTSLVGDLAKYDAAHGYRRAPIHVERARTALRECIGVVMATD